MNQNIVTQYISQMLQSLALSDALQAFHAATDKELAGMAAYKALGLNPSDAPKFGWNLSERPGMRITNTTIGSASDEPKPQAVPSPSAASRPAPPAGWLRTALVAAGCLLAGSGGAAMLSGWLTKTPATQPSTAPASPLLKPQEFDIQFRIEGGELKIDPPAPVNP